MLHFSMLLFFLSLHFVSNIISGAVLLIFYVFGHLYCDISASSVISLFTFFSISHMFIFVTLKSENRSQWKVP